MSVPYKVLIVEGIGHPMMISGDRDALVELRSAISEALAHGVAHADVAFENGDDAVVTVERIGA